MKLKPQYDNMSFYLKSDEIVDFNDNAIKQLSKTIISSAENETDFVRRAYEYVRDEISHSHDIGESSVTFKATDVLMKRHGICFAKSNLLAAILRREGVPCGFCYQRLILDDETAPYLILHGLNAVYLNEYKKWIRLDSRGNKEGINAEFCTNEEKLAFPIRKEFGEEDIPVILANPDENVVMSFNKYDSLNELWNNLTYKIKITSK